MATALTVYANSQVSSTVSTANKLITGSTGGGTSTSNSTVGNSTAFGEITAQGTLASWPALGASPAPTGLGWFFDATTLDNHYIQPGSWTFEISCGSSGSATFTINMHVRAYMYQAGVYTQIGDSSTSNQSVTSTITTHTWSDSFGGQYFPPGSKLYIDIWFNITAHTSTTGATTIVIRFSSSTTLGNVLWSAITPGYVSYQARDLSTRIVLKSIDTNDVGTRLRFLGVDLNDLKTRLRFRAVDTNDLANRLRLRAVDLNDLFLRARLKSQPLLRDLAQRMRLRAIDSNDLRTRLKLLAVDLNDLSLRLRLFILQKRDLSSRLRLRAVDTNDLRTRFRFLAIDLNDLRIRLFLTILQQRDWGSRTRLRAIQLSDFTTRLRFQGLPQFRFLASRLLLLAQHPQDIGLRLKAMPGPPILADPWNFLDSYGAAQRYQTLGDVLPILVSDFAPLYTCNGVALVTQPTIATTPQLASRSIPMNSTFTLLFQNPDAGTQALLATNRFVTLGFLTYGGILVEGPVVVLSGTLDVSLLYTCILQTLSPITIYQWVVKVQFP